MRCVKWCTIRLALCVLLSIQSPGNADVSMRFLTQSRPYLKSGYLGQEDAIVTYIGKLHQLQKKCEAEGRYPEAEVAANR